MFFILFLAVYISKDPQIVASVLDAIYSTQQQR